MSPDWVPPSAQLTKHGSVWQSGQKSPVSYPESDNEICYQIEDGSWWFNHRRDVILTALKKLPPTGALYDIGGGNGFVSAALQAAGHEVVLVEPGPGAQNGCRRGVRHVIRATLQDANFHPHSLPAVGLFDVLEHIEDDIGFLHAISRKLSVGGRLYCTVPAGPMLWSTEDQFAGHYRRYNKDSLSSAFAAAGFEVEYITCFFGWLILPVALFRALPSRMGLKQQQGVARQELFRSEHRLSPWLSGIVGRLHRRELRKIGSVQQLSMGTSLLVVARTHRD